TKCVVRFNFRGDMAVYALKAVKDHLKKEGPHWNITTHNDDEVYLVVRGIHESDAKRIAKWVESTIPGISVETQCD
uniref:Minibinder B8_BP_dslf n=1 Tax=synthetic construct TaxID=32630 RepID=UPI002888F87C|nr:Chain C, Minibinder B8_BP_dslf [synthetic construct]